MGYCNGTMHLWSDDSYVWVSYPCPGPPQCLTSKKETLTVTPAPRTKFEIVTQVVMIEYVEQRDDPPGRDPYAERETVLAENRKDVPPHQVAERVNAVVTIA